jgi:protein TonB
MKLALFFLLSFVVHASALLVPISLNGWAPDRGITVTILPLEFAIESGAGSGDGRTATNRLESTQVAKTAAGARRRNSTPTLDSSAQYLHPVETRPASADKAAAASLEVSTDGIPIITGESLAIGNGGGGSNVSAGGIGRGVGTGSGHGEGSGNGQAGTALTQPRYRETPQPVYPDSARREGKEGRVVFRVLVDEEGRTKAIEINSSSGHALLDRAATQAIRKWRFVPAHAGGKPIETWVKVPIEFQLSNAKP